MTLTSRSSFLMRFIAVTLVAAMVLTMPGMTAWANSDKNTVLSANTSSGNQPPLIVTGSSPRTSYRNLPAGTSLSPRSLAAAGIIADGDVAGIERTVNTGSDPIQVLDNAAKGLRYVNTSAGVLPGAGTLSDTLTPDAKGILQQIMANTVSTDGGIAANLAANVGNAVGIKVPSMSAPQSELKKAQDLRDYLVSLGEEAIERMLETMEPYASRMWVDERQEASLNAEITKLTTKITQLEAEKAKAIIYTEAGPMPDEDKINQINATLHQIPPSTRDNTMQKGLIGYRDYLKNALLAQAMADQRQMAAQVKLIKDYWTQLKASPQYAALKLPFTDKSGDRMDTLLASIQKNIFPPDTSAAAPVKAIMTAVGPSSPGALQTFIANYNLGPSMALTMAGMAYFTPATNALALKDKAAAASKTMQEAVLRLGTKDPTQALYDQVHTVNSATAMGQYNIQKMRLAMSTVQDLNTKKFQTALKSLNDGVVALNTGPIALLINSSKLMSQWANGSTSNTDDIIRALLKDNHADAIPSYLASEARDQVSKIYSNVFGASLPGGDSVQSYVRFYDGYQEYSGKNIMGGDTFVMHPGLQQMVASAGQVAQSENEAKQDLYLAMAKQGNEYAKDYLIANGVNIIKTDGSGQMVDAIYHPMAVPNFKPGDDPAGLADAITNANDVLGSQSMNFSDYVRGLDNGVQQTYDALPWGQQVMADRITSLQPLVNTMSEIAQHPGEYLLENPGKTVSIVSGAAAGVALSVSGVGTPLGVAVLGVVSGAVGQGAWNVVTTPASPADYPYTFPTAGQAFMNGATSSLGSGASAFLVTAPLEKMISAGFTAATSAALSGGGALSKLVRGSGVLDLGIVKAASQVTTTVGNASRAAWDGVLSTPYLGTAAMNGQLLASAATDSLAYTTGFWANAVTAPGRFAATMVAAPLVPMSLRLYGLETAPDGSFSAQGLLGAITAPSNAIWGNLAEGDIGQPGYRPQQAGLITLGDQVAKSISGGDGLLTDAVNWVSNANKITTDVMSFGVGGNLAGGLAESVVGPGVTAEIIGKGATALPMVGFYEGQIQNLNNAMATGDYSHFASGVAQMAVGVVGAQGGYTGQKGEFLNPLSEEGGGIVANTRLGNAALSETVKLGAIAGVGSLTGMNTAVAYTAALAPIAVEPIQQASNQAKAAADFKSLINTYNAAQMAQSDSTVLAPTNEMVNKAAAALAPHLRTEMDGSVFLGDQKLNADNPVVQQAQTIAMGGLTPDSVAELAVSGDEAGQALLNKVVRGNPIDVNGRDVIPSRAVVEAANEAVFDQAVAAKELGVQQLVMLHEGNGVLLSDGRAVNGEHLDSVKVDQALADHIVGQFEHGADAAKYLIKGSVDAINFEPQAGNKPGEVVPRVTLTVTPELTKALAQSIVQSPTVDATSLKNLMRDSDLGMRTAIASAVLDARKSGMGNSDLSSRLTSDVVDAAKNIQRGAQPSPLRLVASNPASEASPVPGKGVAPAAAAAESGAIRRGTTFTYATDRTGTSEFRVLGPTRSGDAWLAEVQLPSGDWAPYAGKFTSDMITESVAAPTTIGAAAVETLPASADEALGLREGTTGRTVENADANRPNPILDAAAKELASEGARPEPIAKPASDFDTLRSQAYDAKTQRVNAELELERISQDPNASSRDIASARAAVYETRALEAENYARLNEDIAAKIQVRADANGTGEKGNDPRSRMIIARADVYRAEAKLNLAQAVDAQSSGLRSRLGIASSEVRTAQQDFAAREQVLENALKSSREALASRKPIDVKPLTPEERKEAIKAIDELFKRAVENKDISVKLPDLGDARRNTYEELSARKAADKPLTDVEKKIMNEYEDDYVKQTEITLKNGFEEEMQLRMHPELVDHMMDTLFGSKGIKGLLETEFDKHINGQRGVINPFKLKWNELQSAETIGYMDNSNNENKTNIEASVSGGKTIMNVRAALTTLLKGSSEGAIILLRSPTAIEGYKIPLIKTLTGVFGKRIEEIDGTSKQGNGWLDVADNVRNRNVINVGTWTEITQMVNQVMEADSPAARAELRDFQDWATKHSVRIIIDEAHEWLRETTEGIIGDNGIALEKIYNERKVDYDALWEKVNAGLSAKNADGIARIGEGDAGVLKYMRDDSGAIKLTPELAAYLGESGRYNTNMMESALGAALSSPEYGGQFNAEVSINAKPGGEGILAPNAKLAGIQAERIIHNGAKLVFLGLLYRDMAANPAYSEMLQGKTVDWANTRAGGKTVAATGLFEVLTFFGAGEVNLVSGTLTPLRTLVKMLTGKGIFTFRDIPSIELSGDSKVVSLYNASSQKIRIGFDYGQDSTEARSMMADRSADILLNRLGNENGNPLSADGLGQWLGTSKVNEEFEPFKASLVDSLLVRAEGSDNISQLLTREAERLDWKADPTLDDSTNLQNAIKRIVDDRVSTIDEFSVHQDKYVDSRAEAANRQGKIVLVGEVGWVGVNVKGDNMAVMGLDIQTSGKSMAEQLAGRVNRQNADGFFKGGTAELFASRTEMDANLKRLDSLHGDDLQAILKIADYSEMDAPRAAQARKRADQVIKLIDDYRDGKLDGFDDAKLFLTLHYNEAIEISNAYKQAADRIYQQLLIRDPYRQWLSDIEDRLGLNSAAYKAAKSIYVEQVLQQDSELNSTYALGDRTSGKDILKSKFMNSASQVDKLSEMVRRNSALKGERATFAQKFDVAGVDAARARYDSIEVNKTTSVRALAGSTESGRVEQLVGLVKNMEGEVLSGLATTNYKPTSLVMRQDAVDKTNSGGTVSDGELRRIQSAAARDVRKMTENGSEIPGRIVAMANADLPTLRELTLGDVSAIPGRINVGNRLLGSDLVHQANQTIGGFTGIFSDTYNQARNQQVAAPIAVFKALNAARAISFGSSLPMDLAVQSQAQSFAQTEAALARMSARGQTDAGLLMLRDIQVRNLSRLTDLNPIYAKQITDQVQTSIDSKTDATTAARIKKTLTNLVTASADGPKSNREVKPGYVLTRDLNAKVPVTLVVNRLTPPAILRVLQIMSYAAVTGTRVHIHLPEVSADAAKQVVATLISSAETARNRALDNGFQTMQPVGDAKMKLIDITTGDENRRAVGFSPIADAMARLSASLGESGLPSMDVNKALDLMDQLAKKKETQRSMLGNGAKPPSREVLQQAIQETQELEDQLKDVETQLMISAPVLSQAFALNLVDAPEAVQGLAIQLAKEPDVAAVDAAIRRYAAIPADTMTDIIRKYFDSLIVKKHLAGIRYHFAAVNFEPKSSKVPAVQQAQALKTAVRGALQAAGVLNAPKTDPMVMVLHDNVFDNESFLQLAHDTAAEMGFHSLTLMTSTAHKNYTRDVNSAKEAAMATAREAIPKTLEHPGAYASRSQVFQTASFAGSLIISAIVGVVLATGVAHAAIVGGIGTGLMFLISLPVLIPMLRNILQARRQGQGMMAAMKSMRPAPTKTGVSMKWGMGLAAVVVVAAAAIGAFAYGTPVAIGAALWNSKMVILSGGNILSFIMGAFRHAHLVNSSDIHPSRRGGPDPVSRGTSSSIVRRLLTPARATTAVFTVGLTLFASSALASGGISFAEPMTWVWMGALAGIGFGIHTLIRHIGRTMQPFDTPILQNA